MWQNKIIRSIILLFVIAFVAVIFMSGKKQKCERNFSEFLAQKNKQSENVYKKEQGDLNNDSNLEIYILENGKLIIEEDLKTIWHSPTNWWVDSFTLGDSNNDGVRDLNLSLWKAGDFGSSKPFWIKENDMSVKNHFFILDYVDGKFREIWGSSNLEAPNCQFDIKDIDGDGKNDLIVLEGEYSENYICIPKYEALWKWNGWGFSNEWRRVMSKN